MEHSSSTVRAALWVGLCSGAAWLVRTLLDPVLGDSLPYAPAFGAIAVVAWSAGWKAGLACALVSQVWANYFFIPPRHAFSYSSADLAGIAAYYAVTLLLLFPTHRAHQAMQARDKALAALRAEGEKKNHFLAVLAHELRGPVQTAKLGVELADRDDVRETLRREAHARIRRQLAHIENLCADLMDTAKAAQGKMTLNRQRVEAGELLRQAIERSKPALDARQQSIDVHSGDDAAELSIDLGRMVQAVCNVLDNASKYSPVASTIHLEAERVDDSFRIRVTDEGRGFDAATAARLFDTFFQAAPGSEGLGLGLPLVREIVQLHGGSVTAHSPGAGMGATFELHLPGCVLPSPTAAARGQRPGLPGGSA